MIQVYVLLFIGCIKFTLQDSQMANSAAVRRRCFKWDIFNPFLPWRNLEDTFYIESPAITKWKVAILPLDQRINSREFSFSLVFEECHEIIANYVKIYIKLNDANVSRREVSNYFFSRVNGYTYYFQGRAVVNPQMKPHHLAIEIEISLPENAAGNGLIFNEDDLRWLSRDLRLLLTDRRRSNMKLKPKNGREIPAHSCIIDARWDNFFKEHKLDANNRASVETNISEGLLLDILAYMYSGTLETDWSDKETTSYMAELFQVIGKYKLHHLQKVFSKNDLQQVRVTRTSDLAVSCIFPLLMIKDGRIKINASHLWHVHPSSEGDYNLFLQFRVRNENRNGPWLSYSVLSKCRSSVCARVNLEVVKDMGGNAPQRVWSLHEKEYTVHPNSEPEKSECVLFLGCPETFGDLNSDSSDGTKIKFFVRCFLNVSDGTTFNQVQSVGGDALQNRLERFNVLSYSLHELRKRRLDADIQILSRSVDAKAPYEDEYLDRIHRIIFEIRVPNYPESLENVPRENDITETARSTLSSETLPIVLDYVYTGKTFIIPKHHLDEIEGFAKQTRFFSLKDLVLRNRLHYN